MALNPLVLPNHALQHARSTSASSSHSASSALYDLSYNSNNFGLPVRQGYGGEHTRNPSGSSGFATQLTSPADSPPDVPATIGGSQYGLGPQSGFKPSPLARSSSYTAASRRSRAGSNPYSHARTPDEFSKSAFGFSSTSSRSSSCSDAEADDFATMYFNGAPNHQPTAHQHSLGPLAGHAQQADYSGLFVAPPPQQSSQGHPGYGVHPNQLGGGHVNHHFVNQAMGPLDPSASAFGAGMAGLSPEAQLEQLAANVRSSTTTTASDRAKQVFVQAWLSANYAPYPDGNVPRQGLYNSYRRVCDFYNIPHINTATLGKAIRLCFPSIKTRRLGVRGNSKYHYCGIRPATVTEAEFLQDFVRRTTNHQAIAASSRRGAAAAAAAAQANMGGAGSDEEDDEDSEASSNAGPGSYEGSGPFSFGQGHASSGSGSSIGAPTPLNTGANPSVPHPLTLGGGLKSPTLYHMLGADDKTPTTNTLLSAAQAQSMTRVGGGISYGVGQTQIRNRRGLGGSGDSTGQTPGGGPGSRPGTSSGGAPPFGGSAPLSVRNLHNFPSIDEALGASASANGENAENGSNAGSPPSGNGSPQHLAAVEVWKWFEDHLDGLLEAVRGWRFDQFEIHVRTFWGSLNGDYREVVHAPAVAGLVVRADAIVYDEILEMLRTQMLSSIPPHALTSLRQLAEKMEKILLLALEGYGNTFVEPKVELGARFGHLVLRFLDMYQVTQALTSVLSNAQQLQDMRRSWNDIDFEGVRNQSALVCNCRHEDLVQLLEVDFVGVLDGLVTNATMGVSGVEPVREMMNWADLCCERLMGRGADGDEKSGMSSRSVLIRWGYVTSQIMRDLTIRSDPAFGAFQILKLFLDDWIALNVLRSVALSTNSVQASVEPVMQQQYLALSPMPGQEYTGSNAQTAVPHSLTAQLMDHTPTTTSMLAALHDTYNQNGQQNNSASNFYAETNLGEYGGSFDMSFLNGSPAGEGHSPAAGSVAGSVGSSSASVNELAAGVAAAAVVSESEDEDVKAEIA